MLFYLGIFAAIFTSILGHAAGLGSLGHARVVLRWRTGQAPDTTALQRQPVYRGIVLWCLISPLVWTLPGMPDFVMLTLVANSAQVVLVPLLAGRAVAHHRQSAVHRRALSARAGGRMR